MTRSATCLAFLAALAATPALAQTATSGAAGQNQPRLMRADRNGDGIVSREEYAAYADRQFDRLDGNGDGVIDAQEVDAAAERIYKRIKARMQAQFKRADANGDGRETREEFQAQAQKRFARMDPDQDGKLRPEDMRRGFGRAQAAKPAEKPLDDRPADDDDN